MCAFRSPQSILRRSSPTASRKSRRQWLPGRCSARASSMLTANRWPSTRFSSFASTDCVLLGSVSEVERSRTHVRRSVPVVMVSPAHTVARPRRGQRRRSRRAPPLSSIISSHLGHRRITHIWAAEVPEQRPPLRIRSGDVSSWPRPMRSRSSRGDFTDRWAGALGWRLSSTRTDADRRARPQRLCAAFGALRRLDAARTGRPGRLSIWPATTGSRCHGSGASTSRRWLSRLQPTRATSHGAPDRADRGRSRRAVRPSPTRSSWSTAGPSWSVSNHRVVVPSDNAPAAQTAPSAGEVPWPQRVVVPDGFAVASRAVPCEARDRDCVRPSRPWRHACAPSSCPDAESRRSWASESSGSSGRSAQDRSRRVPRLRSGPVRSASVRAPADRPYRRGTR